MNRKAILSVLFSTLLLGMKAATSAVTIPLMMWKLGADATALWLLVQTAWNYAFFAELGVSQIIMNQAGAARARGDYAAVSRVAATGVVMTIGFTVALAAAAFALTHFTKPASLLLGSENAAVGRLDGLLAIALPAAILRIPGTAFAGLLSGFDDHHLRTAFDSIQPAIVLVAVVGAILAKMSLEGVVAVFAITSVVVSLLPAIPLLSRHPYCRIRFGNVSIDEAKTIASMVRQYAALPFLLSAHRSLPVFAAARTLPLDVLPGIYLVSLYFRMFFVNLLDSVSKSVQPRIIAGHAEQGTRAIRGGWLDLSGGVGLAAGAFLPVMIVVYIRYAEPMAHIHPPTAFLVAGAFAVMFWLDSSISVGVNHMLAIGQFGTLTRAWTFGLAAKLIVLGIAVHGAFISTPAALAVLLLACDAILWFPANLAAFSRSMAIPFATVFRTMELPWLSIALLSTALCGLIERASPNRAVEAVAALSLSAAGLLLGQRFLTVPLRLWLRNRFPLTRLRILFA